jgi:uroporphyrinogen-III synthase
MTKHILLTRPREDSEAMAADIEALGYIPFIEPMLEIVPQAASFPDFDDYGGFVFTSANAVKTLPNSVFDQLPALGKPVYALAPHTGQSLPWFAQYAITEKGSGLELSARIAKDLAAGEVQGDKPFLHICGIDVARPMMVDGLVIEQFPVYKAEAAQVLSDDCQNMIRNGDFFAATFFSTRTAETFVSLAVKYGLDTSVSSTKALCLADSMVKSVRALPWQDVQAASQPEKQSLLELLKAQ